MSEPTLEAVLFIELIALMVEGALEKPCRYVEHVPWLWFNTAGLPLCGVCHPPSSAAVSPDG